MRMADAARYVAVVLIALLLGQLAKVALLKRQDDQLRSAWTIMTVQMRSSAWWDGQSPIHC